ncbi:MAG: nicotinate (nicotinamide) nucleotide adenylyltransferase [Ruminococcaceae bacterium]|nr:nicotinate (nicotinamide) nucleotide adenylyltransferase [Oscillospiraceae bacterium]
MKRLGIYGGSFNPIHIGHIKAANAFYDEMKLDELIIMPTAVSPFKTDDLDNDPRERLKMVNAAFENSDRNILVSDYEIEKGGKSYTYLTLEHFSAPENELYFLMGTDMLLSLDGWKNPDIILKLATVCHIRREDVDPETEKAIEEAKSRYEKEYNAKIIDLVSEPFEVSSTEIRNAVKEGKSISGLVTQEVEDIIKKDKLYLTCPLYAAVRTLVKEKRWKHIFGTEEEAKSLSQIFDLSESDSERLRRAALLHDITKYLTRDEHLAFLESVGVTPDEGTLLSDKTLHQMSGAYMARKLYPEYVDDAVFDAIRYHTTGKAEMPLLTKLMYLCDFIEPTRTFPDCVKLRAIFYEMIEKGNKLRVLDEIMLIALDMTVADLNENGHPIHSDTEKAREYIIEKLKGNNYGRKESI